MGANEYYELVVIGGRICGSEDMSGLINRLYPDLFVVQKKLAFSTSDSTERMSSTLSPPLRKKRVPTTYDECEPQLPSLSTQSLGF